MIAIVIGLGAVAEAQESTAPDSSTDVAAVPEEENLDETDQTDEERAEGTSFSGTLRTGIEYDSNAYRQPVENATGDMLGRYFGTVEGRFQPSSEARLTLQLRQGGKLFLRERGSDALLTKVGLNYRHWLGRNVYALFDFDMKDRLERRRDERDVPHQDYNRGGIGGGLGVVAGPVEAFATAGWRYFAFRPNPASSSHGPQATAGLRTRVHEFVRLHGQYTFSYRNFHSIRFVRRSVSDGENVVQRSRSGELRDDRLHIAQVGGAFRGPFIVGLDYTVLHNASNSYGQGMTRHGIELSGTAPLPGRLYLSGRLGLQRTNYEDPLFLSADLEVDEDNRNSAVVSLTRVFGEHWELEGRYRLFIEEFGDASDYRRQTGFMGLGYLF